MKIARKKIKLICPVFAALINAVAAAAVVLKWPAAAALSALVTAAILNVLAVCVIVRLISQLSEFFSLCGSGSNDSASSAVQRLRKHMDGNARKLIAVEQQKSDLQLQLQLLRRHGDSIEEILDTIRDAVLVTDDQDRVILCNLSCQSLLDFEFDKDRPISISQIGDCGKVNQLAQIIEKTRSSRVSHVRHEITFDQNGSQTIFDAVFSSLEENGRVMQVVAVLHDVTKQKEIARMKNDFVSHVSHELKTPLASINAYAEMLIDGDAQDEKTMHQFCSIIQGQAQRLSRLIEDILNISRIESGLVKVKRENHSLAMVIRDAAAMIESYAQEKNISVTAPAPILYDQVCIDKDMISQVVINLLSNAVKYTPAGGQIAIKSDLNEVDGQVTVSVTDTGVGIPPEAIDHVFDKFYRVEANNKYAKGTGLGLNLVKEIVETVHGGKVFVTSTPGKGSTFGFVLPLSKEPAALTA